MAIECRNYTKADRHPFVVGKLPGDKNIPWPLTYAQVAIGSTTLTIIGITAWLAKGWLVGVSQNTHVILTLVALAVVFGPVFLVRTWKPDHRDPLRHLLAMTKDAMTERWEARQ